MTISLDKKYRTANHKAVKIFMIDGGGTFPIKGVIQESSGEWSSACWTKCGTYYLDRMFYDFDLVEIPEETKHSFFIKKEHNQSPILWMVDSYNNAASYARTIGKIEITMIGEDIKGVRLVEE